MKWGLENCATKVLNIPKISQNWAQKTTENFSCYMYQGGKSVVHVANLLTSVLICGYRSGLIALQVANLTFELRFIGTCTKGKCGTCSIWAGFTPPLIHLPLAIRWLKYPRILQFMIPGIRWRSATWLWVLWCTRKWSMASKHALFLWLTWKYQKYNLCALLFKSNKLRACEWQKWEK